MFEIKGKYATALITTQNIEEEAIAQITELVNNEASKNSYIAIMPDVHAGAGCVIGTTMTITDRVVPNLVGVDIGCGVLAVEIQNENLDFAALQEVIDKYVPAGFNVHASEEREFNLLNNLKTPLDAKTKSHILRSVGTLGGGNHFISVESNGTENFLCIHTGSRNLGIRVAKYHQDKAVKTLQSVDTKGMIEELKANGQEHLIAAKLKEIKDNKVSFNKDLAYLTGQEMKDYLFDLDIAQMYAKMNRRKIAFTIFKNMNWEVGRIIESVHNYIDTEDMILRKGSVAAPIGELFLVPLNMKDGTLICHGKENEAWNQSAPHGAGRAMSRRKAKDTINLQDYKDEMEGIWSTSVNQSTLDEAPAAYKPAEEIKGILSETYEVVTHLHTLFNFKASE